MNIKMATFNLNPWDPLCTLDHCLSQVIGNVDRNPLAQVEACNALFGGPSTVSSTLPGAVVFSTSTITVLYVDTTATISTAYSTVQETSTSTINVAETVTDITATRVATATAQVTAPAVTFLKKKRGPKNKRSACKAKSSTASSTAESSTAESSIVPSSTAEASTAESSTAESSTVPSSAVSSSTIRAPLFPTATNCLSLDEYSSACSCIGAVSSATTVTEAGPITTSIISETVSSAVPTTPVSIVTVVVTQNITELATATATTTIGAIKDVTSTYTMTTTAVAATQTAYLRNSQEKLLYTTGSYFMNDYNRQGLSTKLEFDTSTGRVSLAGQPAIMLWLRTPAANYGVLWFQTAAQKTSSDIAVACIPDVATSALSCRNPASSTWNVVISCGGYMYLGMTSWVSTAVTAGCFVTPLKLSKS
ncbi:hypothetical protein B0H63DRAFT_213681 [Podospora didyma]|uniref:Uncharacterized protein n=1 Tax=Podospora didyma TaxID=330526 RepID=A0AAE0TW77_9PEZI|nr:hypothetical protein B0H63DRAFT_213681 [Podospora didyma]